MGFESFMETYGSVLLLFILILGYLLLKRFLTNKRMENRRNVFEEPEEIARLSIDQMKKKTPDLLLRYGNLTVLKELIVYQVSSIKAVISSESS